MKAFVSINGQTIRTNSRNATDLPPIRIAKSAKDKKPRYVHEININGPSKLTYTADCRQLVCGARLVLETEMEAIEVVR